MYKAFIVYAKTILKRCSVATFHKLKQIGTVADPGILKRGLGGGWFRQSRRGRIFRSGLCFDAPSHILYVFVVRVVNKIHNVNIVY